MRSKFEKQNDYNLKVKRIILLFGEKWMREQGRGPLVDGMIYVLLYYYEGHKVHGNLIILLVSKYIFI